MIPPIAMAPPTSPLMIAAPPSATIRTMKARPIRNWNTTHIQNSMRRERPEKSA